MFEALVKERVEFVDLLLENGLSMSSFLTARRLEDLYRSVSCRTCWSFISSFFSFFLFAFFFLIKPSIVRAKVNVLRWLCFAFS